MTSRARPAQTSYTTSLQGPRQRDPALSKNSADKAVTLSDDNAAKPSIRPESTTGQAENRPTTRARYQIREDKRRVRTNFSERTRARGAPWTHLSCASVPR